MREKAIMRCVGYRPHCSGSLRGFASSEFPDLKMTVHGITVHVHENGSSWASPPTQAIIKSGVAVKDECGKVAYSPPLLEFRGAGVRRAWSDAVIRAVLPLTGTPSIPRGRRRDGQCHPQNSYLAASQGGENGGRTN